MSQNIILCPTCDDQLPDISQNPCGPELLDGGLLGILFARPDQPFVNIEDPAEHTNRTSDTSAAADAVRRLLGVGSFSVEFGASFKIGRLTYYNKSVGTINLKVYDNNLVNYELIRLLGCNTSFSVWLLDSNGLIYGGNDGFKLVLQGRENIVESLEEKKFLEIQGIVEFKNALPRNDYPLFADLEGQI
jgi:hypothetical protein